MHSSQLSLLTMCAELITNCLYPLTFCHVYIPVLPRQCLYIPTNSPVPFLLGFHTEAFVTVASQLPDTVTVVDLDNNTVIPATNSYCPPMPERRRVKLLKSLKECANLFELRDSHWPERCLKNLDDPFTQSGRPTDTPSPRKASLPEDNRVDWDAVRDAFLGFFVALLRDYRKYMIYPTKENPRPTSIFKNHDFVASHPTEWGSFVEELCKTQAFQSFLDARLTPDPEDTDATHFDDAVDQKLNRSRFAITRRNTPFYKPKVNIYQETKTIVALQPDLSGLPSEPFVYNGFPTLNERWYEAPRSIIDLAGDEGHGPRKGKKRKNNILRFKSDHVPKDPATLVFSTFVMSYAPTIGRDLHDIASDSKSRDAERRRSSASVDLPPPPPPAPEPPTLPPPPPMPLTGTAPIREDSRSDDEEEEAKPAAATTTAEKAADAPLARESRSGSSSSLMGPPPSEIPETPTAGASGSQTAASAGEGEGETPAPVVEEEEKRVTRSRPKMRRLSEDLKEERLHAANGKLSMAFDVLHRMKVQHTGADEWIYRSLIDACGRLGNVDLAMEVRRGSSITCEMCTRVSDPLSSAMRDPPRPCRR